MLDIEQSLSTNICRCTGYRPILEAFKKFASDTPSRIKVADIEDLCKKTKDVCLGQTCKDYDWCFVSDNDMESDILYIQLTDGRQWYRVLTVPDVLQVLSKNGIDSYMLVAGNTAKGAYPIIEYPKILIDISGISELKGYIFDQNLIVGSGSTLTEFIEILKEASDTEYFEYLKIINDHLHFVAHDAVRNIGTIAGNLMIKHSHREFPSDVFLVLETIGAELTLSLNTGGALRTLLTFEKKCCHLILNTFWKCQMLDMKGKIILNVKIPPLSKHMKLVTYKVSARARNAHAIVNAGFLYKLNRDNQVVSCRIVYGGLSPGFFRASRTEANLIRKSLFSNDTLQTALKVLANELVVTEMPPEPSVNYRKKLALGLFYKGLLSLCPENILNSRYKCGGSNILQTRPVSTGSQYFTTDPTVWPINQPIPKAEALLQCAGETEYTEDIPKLPKEVFSAFVLSTVALGTIITIDATEALLHEGVISFYTAKDIPGVNAFTSPNIADSTNYEEILCSGEVKYYNQPIGIIVAESFDLANRAALMVKVTYSNVTKPEVDIRVNKNNSNKTKLYSSTKATTTGTDVIKIVKGNVTVFSQIHFCLENLMCVSWPTEEGIKIHPTSHYMTMSHYQISRCLNIEQSRIDVEVRRLGGSFGLKLLRQNMVATACALVTYKLNLPCRFILPLSTQTRATGKRMPSSTNYEVGLNINGVIQYINYDLFDDNGYIVNEPLIAFTLGQYNNCYKKEAWNYRCFNVITDTPSNTFCRSPGNIESIVSTETIMERISYETGLDPLQVRLNNLDMLQYSDLIEMVDSLKTDSNYSERRLAVNKFNEENRWRKRGLRFILMRWSTSATFLLNVTLSVYVDGSVAISHGGVEMGQGINTKVIQVCAYFLKIPMHKIYAKPTNTMSSPNNSRSGGSMTSQNISIGVQRCCEQLLKRLEPVRAKLNNPTWEQLIAAAFEQGVNLQANGIADFNDVYDFNVYGVTLAEVEVDILTGQWQIIRVDLLEDVGRSVSPEIDIGQVEGAFLMGVGYLTTEELVYDRNTGELQTDRSWNYFVPGGTDIPQDLRIYFRKKSYTSDVILGSKLTSEPATCMGVVVPFAMREAITSARSETGIPSNIWFDIDGPFTVEKICLACETKLEDFKFY